MRPALLKPLPSAAPTRLLTVSFATAGLSEELSIPKDMSFTAATECGSIAGDLRGHIRSEFEQTRGQKDPYAMKHSLSTGRAGLKNLRETLSMRQ